jgi:hypoxanthine phosphoribosyltransferase
VGTTASLEEAIQEKLFTEQQIRDKVRELAGRLVADFRGRDPLLVGILNGCVPFLSDLVRAMDLPLQVDFISVSSYGGSTKSSGVVRMLKDLSQGIEGRSVVIVEDIIDTGLTLKYLVENLGTRKPASIDICTLLDKAEARSENVDVKYVGFDCPNKFVVGYGLDYAGFYRNLPYIGVLKPQIYK